MSAQLDLFGERLTIVPNHWGKAFHVVIGPLTFLPEVQPDFSEWQDALAWCRALGYEPMVPAETIFAWATPKECSACLWVLWGMTQ